MSEVRSELLDAFENNGNSSPQDTPGYSSYENSSSSDSGSENSGMGGDVSAPIDENGSFTTKDDVALYINTYGKLPKNFMTKEEARVLGWVSGSLEPYAPGMCIGGDYFGNYEERLPKKDGRSYTECDIDTLGASSRGAKRIVFSNDGLIYYTDDHYESFTLLYGEE
ncbi:MAG: ribonuclease [Oscillospiraceae bacterium]|nr:ribonuclease [Oscillospiraceae bacterium]